MRKISDETRIRMCIKEIKEMDKEITIETLQLGFLALSAGIGFLGGFHFGSQVIDIVSANELVDIFNFEVSELVSFIGFFSSCDIGLIGYVLAREKIGVLSASIEYKKYYQKVLNEVCEKHGVKTRRRVLVRHENKI